MKNWNLGNLLLIGGLGLLGLSLAIPYLAARRVSRLEGRAAAHAQRWAAVLAHWPDIDFEDPGVALELLRRFRAPVPGLTDAPGLPELEIQPVPVALQGQAVCFAGGHYYFLVGRVRNDHPYAESLAQRQAEWRANGPRMSPTEANAWRFPWTDTQPESDPRLFLEAYAWPQDDLQQARTVFFVPATGRHGFHRNLDNSYYGMDRLNRLPVPGSGRHHLNARYRRGMLRGYRGYDDLLWLWPLSDRV